MTHDGKMHRNLVELRSCARLAIRQLLNYASPGSMRKGWGKVQQLQAMHNPQASATSQRVMTSQGCHLRRPGLAGGALRSACGNAQQQQQDGYENKQQVSGDRKVL